MGSLGVQFRIGALNFDALRVSPVRPKDFAVQG